MIAPAERTVAEALARHYRDAGFPAQGGVAEPVWSPMSLGPVRLRLTNFAWRRRALPFHDLHHLLTGYPCSPLGELEMAAWEFSAGRFPDARATLFCLPLIGIGATVSPRRAFAAFVRGRHSTTLYGRAWNASLTSSPVSRLRAEILPGHIPRATVADVFAYVGLTVVAMAWTAVPVLLVAGLCWLARS